MGQFRKYKSLYSTTLSSSIGTGTGETITFASVTGVPTDTEITVTIDRVDASGNATPTKMERITGTLSGSNLTSYTREVEGTEQAHSGGAVVEMVWNAYDWNDAIDGVLAEHNQTGTHSDITASTISASTITASAITSTATVSASSTIATTVVDTTNAQAATFTQSDVTNNPIAVQIENDGTNHGLYIKQDGVTAAGDYALYVYSNAAQVNTALVYVHSDNGSSTADVVDIVNDGTGMGLNINQVGVLAASKYALHVQSNAVQNASVLIHFHQDNASSNQDVIVMNNDGTGNGLWISQDGVLASSKYALYVYSNAAQTTSDLVNFVQDNASSDKAVLNIQQDGTNYGLKIDQNGAYSALYIDCEYTGGYTAQFIGKHDDDGFVYLYNEDTGATSGGMIIKLGAANPGASNNWIRFVDGDNNAVGDIDQEVAYNTFTGAHGSQTDDKRTLKSGMIMSSTGELVNKKVATISNAQTMTKIADKENDPTVFGVFTYVKDIPYKGFDKDKDTLAINALGEGKVLVTNKNGEVKNGDYITSSSIAGYGQKQDDDVLHNYTVAKATETVDWKKIKDEVDGYKFALIGCTYHCG